ncbi:MAG: glycosyl hydrolase 115 family protein [Kiritimatiellae bacterium]|nr:glycosyl hydrolase 115 family protein [Kiritimatiellia bacterium]
MKTTAKPLSACAVAAFAILHGVADGVKYRGIFINDEDWSLRPWAVKHFGAEEQIGKSAYTMIFDAMEKYGLNLVWPAMHEGGYEFVSRPENIALAGSRGITVGTSHCEPMLRNNCYLGRADKKKWSWLGNRDFIKDYWQWAVDRYATNNVMWTIGMRGIHDGRMRDGKTNAERIAVLEDVFAEQLAMLEKAGAGSAPRLFVPYKEVLPVFNAGLKVPEGTTIMWVNDNFGYVRRLGGPKCENHGGGIYWHVSYHGRPHGYIHLYTTPPAFMWYELVAKCWNNGVKDVWMVNVGDVFQAELAMFALGKFASDPDSWGPDAQDKVLAAWARDFVPSPQNGEKTRDNVLVDAIVAHLDEYFNLGFIRKPEHMCVYWTKALPEEKKQELLKRYEALLAADIALEDSLPEEKRGEYFRKIGFQVRFLAHSGIIHLSGRDREYAKSVLEPLAAKWDALEGGKWSGFWCDTLDEKEGKGQKAAFNRWASQMQWPWNEPEDIGKRNAKGERRKDYADVATSYEGKNEPKWLEAKSSVPVNGGEWKEVKGLGVSGRALALLPVKPGVGEGASLSYYIEEEGAGKLVLQFLPDFALWPGLKLRVAVAFEGKEGAPVIVEVPKSDSNLNEKDPVRAKAVQDNFIRVKLDIPEGAKAFTIKALDPGVVIDRVGVLP